MSDKKTENIILKDEEALVLDHNYDGIQELDNPLPGWWLAIFYITIAFSAVYVGYYMTGVGPTLRDEMTMAMQEMDSKKPAAPAGGEADDAAMLAMMNDPEKLKLGAASYAGKCAACHGDKGQGLIGPNLTDDFWIHGTGSPSDVAKTVRDGVLDKGMPAWGPVLPPEEIVAVTIFIRTLHGTNPPGAKEPQGAQHPWPQASK